MAFHEKKSKVKLLILILAIAGTIFLIIRLRSAVPPLAEIGEEQVFAPITVDVSVMSDNEFKELRGFGAYPVRSGRVGRENPFIHPSRQELLETEGGNQ